MIGVEVLLELSTMEMNQATYTEDIVIADALWNTTPETIEGKIYTQKDGLVSNDP